MELSDKIRWLRRDKPSHVREAEKWLQRYDHDLYLYQNKNSGFWGVWHVPSYTGAYLILDLKEDGRRLVPGIGVSADTILRWVMIRDLKNLPNRNTYSDDAEAAYVRRLEQEDEKFSQDLKDIRKDTWRYLSTNPMVTVPRNYKGGSR